MATDWTVWPYDSLPARGGFLLVGESINTTLIIIISIFFTLGKQTIWLLGLEEQLHDLSLRNDDKQYGRQIHPFSF